MSAENKRKVSGKVVKRSGDKTISVLAEGRQLHPVYKKTVKTRRKFLVHDQNNEASVGDKVEIIESRPLSKLKSWVLTSVVKQG